MQKSIEPKLLSLELLSDGSAIARWDGFKAVYADYVYMVDEPPVKVIHSYVPAVWEDHVTDPTIIAQLKTTMRDMNDQD